MSLFDSCLDAEWFLSKAAKCHCHLHIFIELVNQDKNNKRLTIFLQHSSYQLSDASAKSINAKIPVALDISQEASETQR